ncbi:MAG: TIGR03618 family F420-dependent PPOX class oxidoreductase [Candidatus Dormibacteraeota bacterium]|nr:TIGR03618 family F420-dependent PPOX class oxidoreductase [Candidatus Dormibacteraeota bacterium]
MSPAELAAFLRSESTMTVATIGLGGRPHLMPVHYYLDPEGRPVTWTYAKSQKARNLERDPRATLQVEAGHQYEELRGAMLEATVEIVQGSAEVAEIGLRVVARYGGHESATADLPDDARARVLAQAPKRVGLRFTVTRAVTWDHRKLNAAAANTGGAATEE